MSACSGTILSEYAVFCGGGGPVAVAVDDAVAVAVPMTDSAEAIYSNHSKCNHLFLARLSRFSAEQSDSDAGRQLQQRSPICMTAEDLKELQQRTLDTFTANFKPGEQVAIGQLSAADAMAKDSGVALVHESDDTVRTAGRKFSMTLHDGPILDRRQEAGSADCRRLEAAMGIPQNSLAACCRDFNPDPLAVTCDSQQRITSVRTWNGIQLNFNELFMLPQLTSLDATDLTVLSPLIPDQVASTGLQTLILDAPKRLLAGSLEGDLGRFPNLQRITIKNAGLSGSISSTMRALNNLGTLDLSDNNFQGAVPSFLAELPNLKTLQLGGNCFDPNPSQALVNKFGTRFAVRSDRCPAVPSPAVSSTSSPPAPLNPSSPNTQAPPQQPSNPAGPSSVNPTQPSDTPVTESSTAPSTVVTTRSILSTRFITESGTVFSTVDTTFVLQSIVNPGSGGTGSDSNGVDEGNAGGSDGTPAGNGGRPTGGGGPGARPTTAAPTLKNASEVGDVENRSSGRLAPTTLISLTAAAVVLVVGFAALMTIFVVRRNAAKQRRMGGDQEKPQDEEDIPVAATNSVSSFPSGETEISVDVPSSSGGNQEKSLTTNTLFGSVNANPRRSSIALANASRFPVPELADPKATGSAESQTNAGTSSAHVTAEDARDQRNPKAGTTSYSPDSELDQEIDPPLLVTNLVNVVLEAELVADDDQDSASERTSIELDETVPPVSFERTLPSGTAFRLAPDNPILQWSREDVKAWMEVGAFKEDICTCFYAAAAVANVAVMGQLQSMGVRIDEEVYIRHVTSGGADDTPSPDCVHLNAVFPLSSNETLVQVELTELKHFYCKFGFSVEKQPWPFEVANLTSLESLYLDGNYSLLKTLTSSSDPRDNPTPYAPFPEDLSGLRNLTDVHLERVLFTDLPISLSNLPVKRLTIIDSSLRRIPLALGRLTRLQQLGNRFYGPFPTWGDTLDVPVDSDTAQDYQLTWRGKGLSSTRFFQPDRTDMSDSKLKLGLNFFYGGQADMLLSRAPRWINMDADSNCLEPPLITDFNVSYSISIPGLWDSQMDFQQCLVASDVVIKELDFIRQNTIALPTPTSTATLSPTSNSSSDTFTRATSTTNNTSTSYTSPSPSRSQSRTISPEAAVQVTVTGVVVNVPIPTRPVLPTTLAVDPFSRTASSSLKHTTRTGSAVRTIITGTGTTAVNGASSTQTIQLVTVGTPKSDGVPVTTAIAIASASSIASALVFGAVMIAVWMRWKRKAKNVGAKVTVPVGPESEATASDTTTEGSRTVYRLVNGPIKRQRPLVDLDAGKRVLLGDIDDLQRVQRRTDANPPIVDGGEVFALESVTDQVMESVLTWSNQRVITWMDSVGFNSTLINIFKDHDVDGPRLLGLTDRILESEIGISSPVLRSIILSVRAQFFFTVTATADPTPPSTSRARQDGQIFLTPASFSPEASGPSNGRGRLPAYAVGPPRLVHQVLPAALRVVEGPSENVDTNLVLPIVSSSSEAKILISAPDPTPAQARDEGTAAENPDLGGFNLILPSVSGAHDKLDGDNVLPARRMGNAAYDPNPGFNLILPPIPADAPNEEKKPDGTDTKSNQASVKADAVADGDERMAVPSDKPTESKDSAEILKTARNSDGTPAKEQKSGEMNDKVQDTAKVESSRVAPDTIEADTIMLPAVDSTEKDEVALAATPLHASQTREAPATEGLLLELPPVTDT
ncbi:hypothetical protein HDU96_007758 [Phlyctochytrium bullatum]|nr:hypothetical protein HDU96_007758 [Phlyctochytrium bullatum]